METTFSYKKNNAFSTLASSHVSGDGAIVIQPGDQAKFPSSFPFRITVYPSLTNTSGNVGQQYGTVFNVNSSSSNSLAVTVASDESPASVDQSFTVTPTVGFTVECDWTYGSAHEYEKAMNYLEEQTTTVYSDSGSANAYAITPSPAFSSYSAGQTFTFMPANVNTGASTLNVNGLGAKAIQYAGAAILPSYVVTSVPCRAVYDGTSFQLISLPFTGSVGYTPTILGVTLGNGTLISRYFQVGKQVTGYVVLTFGSTTSVTGAVRFTMPVTPSSNYPDTSPFGKAFIDNVGTATYEGSVSWNHTQNTCYIYADLVSGSYVTVTNLSSTVPFTFATGSQIKFFFSYEAA